MDMLLISFIAAWVIRHAWDEKVDEFRASNKDVRKDINQRYPNASKDRREQMVRNVARRRAAGWNLYQLRHGWPSLRTAIRDGYKEARRDHSDWQASNPRMPDTKWSRVKDAFHQGWNRASTATARKRADAAAAAAESKPATDPPQQPAAPEQPEARVIPIEDIRRATSGSPTNTNGGSPMPSTSSTGETSGYEASRQFANEYLAALGDAQSKLEQYEASLIAGGLGKDQAVIGSLASAREGFDTAQAGFAAHAQGLDTHAQGAEYASGKGDAAANTEWLGNN